MKAIAVYPGTFDPVTNGHIDLIQRAARLFPRLVVAVAANTAKKPFFSLKERILLLEQALGQLPSLEIIGFENLLIDFARQQGASVIIRGLRAVSDFEYEFQLAGMNRKLNKNIETLFLTPDEKLMFLSSTLVREIASLGGAVTDFVPVCVEQALLRKFKLTS
ncbi:MAG: pantetheine-phosphate adenylyltransferase [Legionellaceae bacterium]|nr:pantetheine-phosphate adenylyltransferase [Legionellaceae bacterium]